MKLYLDEHINHIVGKILRQKGHDVISALDINAKGLSDAEQLNLSTKDKRVLVTYDLSDFINLSREYAIKGKEHYGIILVNSKTAPQKNFSMLIFRLEKLLKQQGNESFENRVIFLVK